MVQSRGFSVPSDDDGGATRWALVPPRARSALAGLEQLMLSHASQMHLLQPVRSLWEAREKRCSELDLPDRQFHCF